MENVDIKLEINNLLDKYQNLYSQKALNFIKNEPVKSTLLQKNNSRWNKKLYPCHYFSIKGKIADEAKMAEEIINILNDLVDKGIVLGYLAPPSTIKLNNACNSSPEVYIKHYQAEANGMFYELEHKEPDTEAVFLFIHLDDKSESLEYVKRHYGTMDMLTGEIGPERTYNE